MLKGGVNFFFFPLNHVNTENRALSGKLVMVVGNEMSSTMRARNGRSISAIF